MTHNARTTSTAPTPGLLPRLIRLRDAPFYLGMDRNRFNAEVRQHLTNIRIGRQGVAFDRLELDAWVEDYVSRNGRPVERSKTWDAKNHRASSREAKSGGSTNESRDTEDWQKVVARLNSRRRKTT